MQSLAVVAHGENGPFAGSVPQVSAYDHAGLVQRVGAIELKQLETDKRIDTVFDALDRGNLLPSGILPAASEFDSLRYGLGSSINCPGRRVTSYTTPIVDCSVESFSR